MKRGKLGKGLLIVIPWVLGALMLVLLLSQMRDFAGIINNAGVVRGGTQRIVKMELAGQSADATQQRVNALLEKLQQDEEARLLTNAETTTFVNDLAAVESQWHLIEDEIDALKQGTGSTTRLVDLSETHFKLADKMVLSAQVRAEYEFLWAGGLCLALFLLGTTIMIFMRRDRVAKLKAAYYTDPLTKLDNLIAFDDRAQQLITSAKGGTYLIAYTNISNFRYINESYGYDEGDQLICALARLLEDACEKDELAAHTSADHFVLLLRNEPERPEKLCAHIESELQSTPDLHFTNVLSFGCGICEVTDPQASIPAVVSAAIAVLKSTPGKTGIARYDEAFHRNVELKNRLEQLMDKALANKELLLYLQPKNLLADGSLAGAEALCRWDSPELGLLQPGTFISVFEKNGFIIQLDFYMLERVCENYPLIAPSGDELAISVNFSRITILQDGFTERVLSLVDQANVPHETIEIEITESAFIMDEDVVIEKLIKLKEKGFRLAMDDFGTGYSSLNLLRKLPIDVLKIDRGFLSENSDRQRSRSVLKGVIDMSTDLGLTTVCEGVETEDQVKMLNDLGCPIGQGYIYAKPLPIDDFRHRFSIRNPSKEN